MNKAIKMKKLNKIILFALITLLIICVGIATAYIVNERHLDEYKLIETGSVSAGATYTQHKVALLGDSWVNKELNAAVKNKLESSGFDIDVISYNLKSRIKF